jgi:hypothetical protein
MNIIAFLFFALSAALGPYAIAMAIQDKNGDNFLWLTAGVLIITTGITALCCAIRRIMSGIYHSTGGGSG